MEKPTAQGDEYILNRDYHAELRLNYQHLLTRQQYQFLLHPSIRLNRPGLKIADIGGGSGIWAIDLAQQLPLAACIDCIDISLDQFPPKKWLPNNVNTIVHDIYEPFPDEYIEKYDIVHVQMFLLALRDGNAGLLIRNLLRLLKPGGYLQWNEVDPEANETIRGDGSTCSQDATEEMMGFMGKPRESKYFHWVSDIGLSMQREEMTSVIYDRHPITEEHRTFWNLNYLMLCEEFYSRLQTMAASEEDRKRALKMRNAIERASIELRSGVAIHAELVLAVGQKPLRASGFPSL